MIVDTYNTKGEKAGTTELPDRIFATRWNAVLVKQVYDGEQANRRHPWAHTKDRAEVRGGGKKPWRQKGLGRARHGSIRSPIWVGGGVTHGPRNTRLYTVKINKKMRQASLCSVLARKTKEGAIVVIDQFLFDQPKTKLAASVFANLEKRAGLSGIGGRSKTLLSVPHNPNVLRGVRNLPQITYLEPRNLNTSALLHNRYVVFDQSSVHELEKVL